MSRMVEARALPALVEEAERTGRWVLVDVDPQEEAPRWAGVLHAETDHDGGLGGDPGDVVVSLEGDSRAFAPADEVAVLYVEEVGA